MQPMIDLDTMDFSKDSEIKNTLLGKIKYVVFSLLDDDDLDYLNAAGEVQPYHSEEK